MKKIKKISIDAKNPIKFDSLDSNSPHIQQFLKRKHRTPIYCHCSSNPIKMVVMLRERQYHLKTHPKNTHLHNEDCFFSPSIRQFERYYLAICDGIRSTQFKDTDLESASAPMNACRPKPIESVEDGICSIWFKVKRVISSETSYTFTAFNASNIKIVANSVNGLIIPTRTYYPHQENSELFGFGLGIKNKAHIELLASSFKLFHGGKV